MIYTDGIYQHYKGDVYKVIGRAKHTETQEQMIIYKDASSNIWVRPKEMFESYIEVDGQQVERFKYLGEFD